MADFLDISNLTESLAYGNLCGKASIIAQITRCDNLTLLPKNIGQVIVAVDIA